MDDDSSSMIGLCPPGSSRLPMTSRRDQQLGGTCRLLLRTFTNPGECYGLSKKGIVGVGGETGRND